MGYHGDGFPILENHRLPTRDAMGATDTGSQPQPLSNTSVWLQDCGWLRMPAKPEVLCFTSA
jgi:hypothetical protein